MAVGKSHVNSVVMQELRRQVVTFLSPAYSRVLEELEDLFSLLMTVSPRYRPKCKDIMMHSCFKEDQKTLLNPYDEVIPLRPDTAIMAAMEYIVFGHPETLMVLEQ